MAQPRYRVEDGRSCVDIQVKTTLHLFDGRDPAPFRERDIDDDAMDYILGAVEELPRRAPLALVVWLTEPSPADLPADEVVLALRSHFTWQRDRLTKSLREHMRRAQFVMLLALVVLGLFVGLAAVVEVYVPDGFVHDALREGLLIVGWVAIWRPVEALLYDWWPLAAQRRVRERLLEAPVAVRTGRPHGPDAHRGGPSP